MGKYSEAKSARVLAIYARLLSGDGAEHPAGRGGAAVLSIGAGESSDYCLPPEKGRLLPGECDSQGPEQW